MYNQRQCFDVPPVLRYKINVWAQYAVGEKDSFTQNYSNVSLEAEKDRALSRGDKRVAKFTGQVRSLEFSGLEKGDEFTFPNDYEIYEAKFGNNTANYIFVELEKEGKKNGRVKQFYPSTMSKSVRVYEQDGTPTDNFVTVKGDAIDEFHKYGSIEKAMEAMKGRTVVVADMLGVYTKRYDSEECYTAAIPVINFVEKK